MSLVNSAVLYGGKRIVQLLVDAPSARIEDFGKYCTSHLLKQSFCSPARGYVRALDFTVRKMPENAIVFKYNTLFLLICCSILEAKTKSADAAGGY